MLVHLKQIMRSAQRNKYAVGAFNTSNLEVTLGIIRGAVSVQAPIIIQVSESTIEYAGLSTIFSIIKTLAETEGKTIPIAVHLDHGKSFEIVKQCVDVGFSSVHIDASEKPFEENIQITQQAAEYAHSRGVWAQAELGAMLGKEGMTRIKVPKNPDLYMTDPGKVKEFIAKTKVDTLAVSVGTLHGLFEGKEKIDFPRLQAINQQIPKTPLVLHGASGIRNQPLRQTLDYGVKVVNIDTDLRIAFTEALRKNAKEVKSFTLTDNKSFTLVKRTNFYDPRKILSPSIQAVANKVAEKATILGSINQA